MAIRFLPCNESSLQFGHIFLLSLMMQSAQYIFWHFLQSTGSLTMNFRFSSQFLQQKFSKSSLNNCNWSLSSSRHLGWITFARINFDGPSGVYENRCNFNFASFSSVTSSTSDLVSSICFSTSSEDSSGFDSAYDWFSVTCVRSS